MLAPVGDDDAEVRLAYLVRSWTQKLCVLSRVPLGHGARPGFGIACSRVFGFGVQKPDVGELE